MEQQKLEFKENIKGMRDKSSVWNFFLRTTDGIHAQCKKCKKVIKCRNTITCLHNHLKLHPTVLNIDEHLATPSSSLQENVNENEPQKKRAKLIDAYFKNPEFDMENVVSKMTACDGLPFSIFCTSDSIRNLFKNSGYNDLPKSPNTIKKIVVQKCQQLKGDLKKELGKLKAQGHKFSASLDEWTSARNRRYMNINVHCPNFQGKGFRNLGLARITGRGTAERCANILKAKLASYDISLEDIACIVTDGASVMCAMGRQLVPSYHQLCFAHGIQLAVLDTLYKKVQDEERQESAGSTGEDTDSDSDNEEGGFVVEQHPNRNRNLHVYRDVDLKNVIEKVRNIVKFFRKSPTRNEFLDNYLQEEQKKMGLILDCKTRWSSLADMIERFLALIDPILKTLIDLKHDITFSSAELALLRELSTSLNIVKATVEALCQENANLLTAETSLQFMVAKLQETNSFISNRLIEAMKNRIAQRRLPNLICTLKYLHNPSKYYAEPPSSIFPSPGNNTITEVIIDINERYFLKKQDSDDDEDEIALVQFQQRQQNETTQETDGLKISLKEQLQKKIDDTISAIPSTSTANLTDREELETSVRMQMALFDRGGPRQVHLSQAYDFLLCIPPTSVECERVFSSTKYICNHLRCSLKDDSLDALSFLRSHFQGKR